MSIKDFKKLADLYNTWQDQRSTATNQQDHEMADNILSIIDKHNISIEKLKKEARWRRKWAVIKKEIEETERQLTSQ